MSRSVNISLRVNSEDVRATVPSRLNLVDFLREELSLTGSHVGCEHGVCGACTITVDGETVRGKHNALQCGFCTPGMLASALGYVNAGGSADRDIIRQHISGNYCRCTGYQSIVNAICDVIEETSV